MKKNIHPSQRKVVFVDVKSGAAFLVDSTVETAETVVWEDGVEYPVVKVEISSSSHPAFLRETEQVEVDRPRADQFNAKFGRTSVH